MSKIVRRMNRVDPVDRLMNSGMPKRVLACMRAKHQRWPLGTHVLANTPVGVLSGRVVRHMRSEKHRCSVDFGTVVDMGDANGGRYCHEIPFRNLRRMS